MADWRDCTLGDLIHVKHGFAFLGEYFSDRGTHVVLTPGNFFEGGGFRAKADKEKWYTGPIQAEYVLRKGSLIVAMTEQAEGLLGSSALIPADDHYLHNQRLGLVEVLGGTQADLGFVYHLFNSPPVRQQIRGSATGTKVRHTSPSRIGAVRIRVPAPAVQRRIAQILSAYDELIENCEQRVFVLEQMASMLYREWFVLFRYPGREKVPLVDSPLGRVPRRWSLRKLGEVLELRYGKALKADARRGGEVPVFGSSGVVGQHDESLTTGPGIIVGRKGNVGSIFWSDTDFFVIDTAYFVSSRLPLRFLYFDLQRKNFINGDAAVPGLSRAQAYGLETLVPPDDLVQRFADLAEGFLRPSSMLRRQADILRRTRDLLLPRLLSGQLAVDELL